MCLRNDQNLHIENEFIPENNTDMSCEIPKSNVISDHDYCRASEDLTCLHVDEHRIGNEHSDIFLDHDYCSQNNLIRGVKRKLIKSELYKSVCYEHRATQLSDSAINIIKSFHSTLNRFKISQCDICKEAWPSRMLYTCCVRCKRDKILPKKFSDENGMIPSSVPPELDGLSQAEEMLIARALPFMNIYCKPRGGQRAYKGHVITFSSNVNTGKYCECVNNKKLIIDHYEDFC